MLNLGRIGRNRWAKITLVLSPLCGYFLKVGGSKSIRFCINQLQHYTVCTSFIMRYGCVGLGRCVYMCIGKLSEGEGVICGICWFWSRGWVCDNKSVYSHYTKGKPMSNGEVKILWTTLCFVMCWRRHSTWRLWNLKECSDCLFVWVRGVYCKLEGIQGRYHLVAFI